MAADRRLALHATLPDRYTDLEVLASTIDHLGRLVALVGDSACGYFPIPDRYWRHPPPRYGAIAVICSGSDVHEIQLNDLDLWFTEIDTLGDGVVLAANRCHPTGVSDRRHLKPVPEDEIHLTENIRVFDSHGRTRAAFYGGDGIEQLMTDRRGRIWTSYCDQSSYWSPNPDGTRSYGFMVGLARWHSSGGEPWMARHEAQEVSWLDCYAMNVGRDRVHACPYPDFSVVEVGIGHVQTITPNTVTRCRGLAVSGSEFAVLDQRRTDDGTQWQIRRARREEDVVVETGRENLVLPDGRRSSGWTRGRVGRDGTLWLCADDERSWYRYDLDAHA
jgi:hypothetical protein